MEVFSNEICQSDIVTIINDKQDMICAGGTVGQGTCQGDSGGPLTYKSGDQHVLIGDVSFGKANCDVGRYSIYGRISFFRLAAIKGHARDACPHLGTRGLLRGHWQAPRPGVGHHEALVMQEEPDGAPRPS